MGLLWDNSLLAFLVVTCLLGGGAGYLTGRAMAQGWQPYALVVFYCFLIAVAVRFLNFALYNGELLTAYYFLLHFVLILILGFVGFRIQRVRQMVGQYPWINESAGPFSWRSRTAN